jgi:hypothetical protein
VYSKGETKKKYFARGESLRNILQGIKQNLPTLQGIKTYLSLNKKYTEKFTLKKT